MPLNLFGLTSDPANRICRLALSAAVQDEVTNLFQEQEAAFARAVNPIAFDGKYKPDDDEVLVIENYDDIDGLHEAIANPLTKPELNPTAESLTSLKALFTGYQRDGASVALIQLFDRRRILSNRGLSLFHSENVFRKVDGAGLTLDGKLSAVLENGQLRFQSFHAVRQILDLSQYYIEATDNDIRTFARLPCLQVQDLEQLIASSDTWVRRKVTLIQQSGTLQNVAVADLLQIAIQFGIQLDIAQNNGIEVIALPTDRPGLKKLLRFLDEDYYMSSILRVPHITNSRRRL